MGCVATCDRSTGEDVNDTSMTPCFKYAYHIAIRVLLTVMKLPYRALMLFFNYPVLLEYTKSIYLYNVERLV